MQAGASRAVWREKSCFFATAALVLFLGGGRPPMYVRSRMYVCRLYRALDGGVVRTRVGRGPRKTKTTLLNQTLGGLTLTHELIRAKEDDGLFVHRAVDHLVTLNTPSARPIVCRRHPGPLLLYVSRNLRTHFVSLGQ